MMRGSPVYVQVNWEGAVINNTAMVDGEREEREGEQGEKGKMKRHGRLMRLRVVLGPTYHGTVTWSLHMWHIILKRGG